MSPQRSLAAILAADVVGFSSMMAQDDAGTVQRLRRLMNEVVRPSVAKRAGRIAITTGDGFIAQFDHATDAFACALEVIEGASKIAGFAVRIGINVGEILIEEGDIYGDAVTLATRLEAIAPMSGVCVSERAWQDLRGLGAEFEDRGEQLLKGGQAVRAFAHVPRPPADGAPAASEPGPRASSSPEPSGDAVSVPPVGPLDAYLAEELGAADAAFVRRWIGLCAAYPNLRWPVTRALGEALAEADGRANPNEALHIVLGRLGWFRAGEMPYGDRVRLLQALGPRDLAIARAALTAYLHERLGEGAPRGGGKASPRAIAAVLEQLPADSTESDPLLPLILRGHRPTDAAIRWAERRHRWPRLLQAWTTWPRLAAISGLILASTALAAATPTVQSRMPWSEPARDSFTYEHIRLSACGAFAGGAPSAAGAGIGAPPELYATAHLTLAGVDPSAAAGSFLEAWIARDLAVALTRDNLGRVRAWSLRTPGYVDLPFGPGAPLIRDVALVDGQLRLEFVGDSVRLYDLKTGRAVSRVTAFTKTPTIPERRSAGRRYLRTQVTAQGVSINAGDPNAPVALIRTSSLHGASVTKDGRIVVLDCDPNGRLDLSRGLAATQATVQSDASVAKPAPRPTRPRTPRPTPTTTPPRPTTSDPRQTQQQQQQQQQQQTPPDDDGFTRSGLRQSVAAKSAELRKLVEGDGFELLSTRSKSETDAMQQAHADGYAFDVEVRGKPPPDELAKRLTDYAGKLGLSVRRTDGYILHVEDRRARPAMAN